MLYLAKKDYSFCFNGVDLVEFIEDEIYDLTGYPISEIKGLVFKGILTEVSLAEESDILDDTGVEGEGLQESGLKPEICSAEVSRLMAENTVRELREKLKTLTGCAKFNHKLISKMHEEDLAAAIVTFGE